MQISHEIQIEYKNITLKLRFHVWKGKFHMRGWSGTLRIFVDLAGKKVTCRKSVLVSCCLQFSDAGDANNWSTPAGSPGWVCVTLKMQKHPVTPGFTKNHVTMYTNTAKCLPTKANVFSFFFSPLFFGEKSCKMGWELINILIVSTNLTDMNLIIIGFSSGLMTFSQTTFGTPGILYYI